MKYLFNLFVVTSLMVSFTGCHQEAELHDGYTKPVVPVVPVETDEAPSGETQSAEDSTNEFSAMKESANEDQVVKSPAEKAVKDEVAAESNVPVGVGNSQDVVYGDRFPEVLAVKVSASKGKSWRFSVTLSSTYDSPQRYADAWRVLDDQDKQLGIRILGHDHASEQPFTRSGGIEIPAGTQTVFIEGRDKGNGWSGQRFEFKLP